MLQRRRFLAIAAAQATPSATARLNGLGPENGATAQRAGLWDVTETVWDTPDAAPVSAAGLVAERRMIGSLLREMLRASADASGPILRIDHLTFNRVDGAWEYVSMVTRAPVAIIPATSFGRAEEGRVRVTFDPLTVAGAGPDVTGRGLRMEQLITSDGPDRDSKDQHFIAADGTGTMWLGHRYAYVRRA